VSRSASQTVIRPRSARSKPQRTPRRGSSSTSAECSPKPSRAASSAACAAEVFDFEEILDAVVREPVKHRWGRWYRRPTARPSRWHGSRSGGRKDCRSKQAAQLLSWCYKVLERSVESQAIEDRQLLGRRGASPRAARNVATSPFCTSGCRAPRSVALFSPRRQFPLKFRCSFPCNSPARSPAIPLRYCAGNFSSDFNKTDYLQGSVPACEGHESVFSAAFSPGAGNPIRCRGYPGGIQQPSAFPTIAI